MPINCCEQSFFQDFFLFFVCERRINNEKNKAYETNIMENNNKYDILSNTRNEINRNRNRKM